MNTAIINEELFKQHSPVTGNTVLNEFLPYLSIAQELYIAPILGDALMDELSAQIVSNSLTENNSRLIVKIAPPLSFHAVYQALPFHWASIVNKGVTIRESENSKGVDIRDIAQLRRWIKDDAEILTSQLIDFLNKHRDDYPLWRPIDKAEEKFDSGFYFPER
jgi:hypothetical protein